jgi:hypothetical protein
MENLKLKVQKLWLDYKQYIIGMAIGIAIGIIIF